mmetsp:Transcript_18286/g.61176  ORF Transcript_18286/g.61176 Transcript_18286/m.61176 type:complete len:276 (+) Transcript_18286:324-1151(+)
MRVSMSLRTRSARSTRSSAAHMASSRAMAAATAASSVAEASSSVTASGRLRAHADGPGAGAAGSGAAGCSPAASAASSPRASAPCAPSATGSPPGSPSGASAAPSAGTSAGGNTRRALRTRMRASWSMLTSVSTRAASHAVGSCGSPSWPLSRRRAKETTSASQAVSPSPAAGSTALASHASMASTVCSPGGTAGACSGSVRRRRPRMQPAAPSARGRSCPAALSRTTVWAQGTGLPAGSAVCAALPATCSAVSPVHQAICTLSRSLPCTSSARV